MATRHSRSTNNDGSFRLSNPNGTNATNRPKFSYIGAARPHRTHGAARVVRISPLLRLRDGFLHWASEREDGASADGCPGHEV